MRARTGAIAIAVAASFATASPASGSPTWLSPVDVGPAGGALAVDDGGNAVVVGWAIFNQFGRRVWASVRPAGGVWSAPEPISGETDFRTISPDVQWDSAGNITAVWAENGVVYAADRPFGGGWQAPLRLSAVTGGVFRPRIAIDRNGNALVVVKA
jgi:hypothetical protein